jgi:ubiquinone/menaquinone biosynthesis C-methylase UbiE
MRVNQIPAQDHKEVVRAEWTAAAPFWKKWNQKLATQSRAATELVVKGADLSAGMRVLDLASGTGEPALSLAKALGSGGRVVATDLVPGMLEAVREKACSQSLTQMEFQVADAEQLPFANGEFDRVTCRFGIMFFPDVQQALREIRRVLKPGGRVSFATWGSLAENPLFSTALGPFLKRLNVPPPPLDAPHIFRFADETKLARTLMTAGFAGVQTSKAQVAWPWPGPPEEAWESMQELAAPFRKLIAAMPSEQMETVVGEVMAGMRRFYDGKSVNFPATVVMVTGTA